jgi:hypothetical protein
MSTRPLYVLTFRAEPNVDGLRAIRALLKSAWRVHRLRCVEIRHSACGLITKGLSDDEPLRS